MISTSVLPPKNCITLEGYEVMNMIRKRQVEGAEKQQIADQNLFISTLFGLAA
jgi:hypothetical protein